jgi:hypothetical protein
VDLGEFFIGFVALLFIFIYIWLSNKKKREML